MSKAAIPVSGLGENEPILWRGRIIETCDQLGIPRGGYNRVVATLRNLGCVEQVSRGYRGQALSEFILHFPPTPEVWETANVKSALEGLITTESPDRLSADIQALRKQLGGINLVEAFSNIEGRLQQLETAVKGLQQQHQQLLNNTKERT